MVGTSEAGRQNTGGEEKEVTGEEEEGQEGEGSAGKGERKGREISSPQTFLTVGGHLWTERNVPHEELFF